MPYVFYIHTYFFNAPVSTGFNYIVLLCLQRMFGRHTVSSIQELFGEDFIDYRHQILKNV